MAQFLNFFNSKLMCTTSFKFDSMTITFFKAYFPQWIQKLTYVVVACQHPPKGITKIVVNYCNWVGSFYLHQELINYFANLKTFF